MKDTVKIIRVKDKYSQCNFCKSKLDVYKVKGIGLSYLQVSICKACLESINNNINEL